ncbi:hypothetical protein M9434_002581 [Picochlorum sp. BPE23]|nr:hypothetical protein M9434_002581 [Picochlorum sp. BPE23]
MVNQHGTERVVAPPLGVSDSRGPELISLCIYLALSSYYNKHRFGMASLIHRHVTLPGNRLYVSTAPLQAKLVQGTRRAHHHLHVAVAATPPKGVTQPPRSPIVPPPMFGFVDNAEVLNSRAAMIGFFALLILEAVAGKGLLELIGVTVGKGLDIGL